MRNFLIAPLLLVLAAAPAARASATFQEQSERLQLIYGYLLDFRPVSAPLTVTATEVQIGVDFGLIPGVDTRVGDRPEASDPPPLLVRPRIRLVTSIGLFAGFAYTPPVSWDGFASQTISAEVGWRVQLGPLYAAVRGSISYDETRGPVTERDVEDHFRSLGGGGDLTLGTLLFDHLAPYVGVGIGYVDTRLRVERDGVVLRANSLYPYGLVGLDIAIGPVLLGVEQEFSSSFVKQVWVGLKIRF